MRVRHGCGRLHDVYLCDDGTMDTVIEVDGHEVRFDDCSEHRDADGAMTRRGLRALAIDACESGMVGDDDEVA